MHGSRAGGARVLVARCRFEAKAGNVVEDKRRREVLIQEAAIEGADVNRVDLLGGEARIVERGLRHLGQQNFGVDVIEFAELGVSPARKACSNHEVSPENWGDPDSGEQFRCQCCAAHERHDIERRLRNGTQGDSTRRPNTRLWRARN
jgi:hypothetical protein